MTESKVETVGKMDSVAPECEAAQLKRCDDCGTMLVYPLEKIYEDKYKQKRKICEEVKR